MLATCHVSTAHWSSCLPPACPVSLLAQSPSFTCHHMIMPCHPYGCATLDVQSYDLYSQLPHGTVQIVQSSFFLQVWKNKHIFVSGSYDVRLSPFKLRWVRIDEAYTHLHFESIMRTLFLGLSKPHQAPGFESGSHLPTKDILVPKRLLTSHQDRDRPPNLFHVFELCHVHLSHQDQL
jgi:hypothetical protein